MILCNIDYIYLHKKHCLFIKVAPCILFNLQFKDKIKMKKILLVFLLSTISLLTFSQSKERPTYDSLLRPYSLEPFKILKNFYGYSYSSPSFEGSKSLVAKDSKLSKGFEISVIMVEDTIRSDRSDGLFFKGIRFRMAGIGRNCVEQGSTLVLELEDGEKLSYSYFEN